MEICELLVSNKDIVGFLFRGHGARYNVSHVTNIFSSLFYLWKVTYRFMGMKYCVVPIVQMVIHSTRPRGLAVAISNVKVMSSDKLFFVIYIIELQTQQSFSCVIIWKPYVYVIGINDTSFY